MSSFAQLESALSERDYHDLVEKSLNTTSFKLVNSKFQQVEGVSGFAGDYHIIIMDVLRGLEMTQLRFFVKSVSSVESKRDFVIVSGGWYKEERMFDEILPRLLSHGGRDVPRCFVVVALKLMVFEDLSTKGYMTLSARESLNLDCVKIALDSIARFHASVFIFEERLSRDGYAYRILQDYEKEFKETFYSQGELCSKMMQSSAKGLATQIDLLYPTKLESLKKEIEEVLNTFPAYVEPSIQFRNTICHGDLWIKNMMFKFDNEKPTHCVLVDFQSYRYSPPAQDVMTFIYLTTDREFRRRHLQQVLNYYHVRMASILQDYNISVDDVISYEDYVASCKYYEKFAVVQAGTHAHTTMLMPKASEDFINVPGYKDNFFTVNRSQHILKVCAEDSVFRQKMYECVSDLKDILKV